MSKKTKEDEVKKEKKTGEKEKTDEKEKEEGKLPPEVKDFDKNSPPNNLKFAEMVIINILDNQGTGVIGCGKVKFLDILRICWLAQKTFQSQGRMVEIDGPVNICGDIHAQFPDLIRLFSEIGFPPKQNYLFLGDYVDRGMYNIETILLCFAFKVRFPNNFFMLRGNHELGYVNERYGLRDEIFTRVGGHEGDQAYTSCLNTFSEMPLTGLVGTKILCMHGGISRHMKNIDVLRKTAKDIKDNEDDKLEVDILWSDPGPVNGWTKNPRGASVMFGEVQVNEVCKRLNIDLIVRGHQVVQDGYEFFSGRKLVTVFSAPHYMSQFDNSAAVCKVSENLEISFHVLKPEKLSLRELANDFSLEPSTF